MRVFAVMAIAAALVACGQPAATNGGAAAQGASAPAANAQAAFITSCTQRVIAQNANMRPYAADQCQQEWQTIVDAGPMADAILAAAPVSGATDAATLRTRLTMVNWRGRPEGTLLAQGALGNLEVQVDRQGPSLNFFWSETGALIPYDLLGALLQRGAAADMVACSALGVGENSKVYRVTAPGRAPFQLSLYDRNAPTANAEVFL